MAAAAIIVLRQTPNAAFAAEKFFKATLNYEHTRRAYGRIASRFLTWCDDSRLELRQITPGLAGEYLSQLAGSAPTKNQTLAALRHFFDALVQRHAVALNPFASVRGMIKYAELGAGAVDSAGRSALRRGGAALARGRLLPVSGQGRSGTHL